MKESLAEYGYIGMTADFFHIGHLHALKECKKRCKRLIVGIMTDDCVFKYKNKRPLMNQYHRAEIVDCLEIVYATWFQETFEYPHHIITLKEYHGQEFLIFDSPEHNRKHADVVIPRVEGISSSIYKNSL